MIDVNKMTEKQMSSHVQAMTTYKAFDAATQLMLDWLEAHPKTKIKHGKPTIKSRLESEFK